MEKKVAKKKAANKKITQKKVRVKKIPPPKESAEPNKETVTIATEQSETPKTLSSQDLINAIFAGFGENGDREKENKAKSVVQRYLKQCIDKHAITNNYNLVFLYDETSMVQSDVDNIYTSVMQFSEQKPILLLVHSSGGLVVPAYLIGKMLHEYAGEKLDAVVPRRAKSAATLLCCAADHIHMGSLSELGPIDPQIDGLPALGLKSAIEHIAELVADHPHATELFAKYMSKTIQPIHLGFYERVAESAVQYAQRLLSPHKSTLGQTPEKIAKKLVYEYKDHGFAIDKHEAQNIFGSEIVKHNTDEYKFGNALYQRLEFIGRVAGVVGHSFYMIGSIASDPTFTKKRRP